MIYIIFSSHFNSDGKIGDQDAGMQGQTVIGWSIFFTCKLNRNTVLGPCLRSAYIKSISFTHDSDKKQDKNFVATAYQVQAAVATAFGVAAARAKMLADQEAREMELLMASIIETQMRLLTLSLRKW
jgi:hypothetical protein